MRMVRRVILGLSCAMLITASGWAQARPLVAIDAGHGGPQAGVRAGDWLEKDLVLELAFVVGAEFAAAGYDVMYTRTRDVNVPWPQRRAMAEEAGAEILLMLHAMGKDDPSLRGTEIYGNLADSTATRLTSILEEELAGLGMTVVVEERPWEFLQSPTVATAMIELAHMTNPAEAELLRSSDFHHKVGKTLVRAAGRFLE